MALRLWAALAAPMAEVSRAQGLLLGHLADVGMALRNHASLAALTENVVKTSEASVRLARRVVSHRWRDDASGPMQVDD